jgi:hypothetical protein
MRVKRRHSRKKSVNMELSGLSADLRSLLALGNLCATAAVISGVQQNRVLWLRESLSQVAVLHRHQLSVVEAIVSLLPLLQQQLKKDISKQVLPVFERVKLPVSERAVLWHSLGNYLLSQNQEKLAGSYFLKAKKQSDKYQKLRQAIADRAPLGSSHIDWHLAGEGQALSLDHAREYRAVANYYLDTTKQLVAEKYVDQLSNCSRELAQRL